MSEPRRLVVWRHGETTYNATGRWQGQLDVPLSDRGKQQAAQAVEALAAYGISQIVASDLSRAAETARALAEYAELPLRFDERFREINAGIWQGLTGGEVRARFGDVHNRITAGEDLRRGETGETVAEVAQRVQEGASDLVAGMAPGETAVIATHGFAGRALCAALTGIPQQVAIDALQGMSNCHWAMLVEYAGGWHLAGWNLRQPVDALAGVRSR
ncbi:histidine phosphatase family protein [Flexivirga caeni]|uniref:Histidine phosphatase family protein n=1 Tax=Flexivirga caeni TaxID=2294115 RepID=A0A3M9MBX1_9MICO|nr:histidine phosphatase family protein [Flexivirga caeni]RNI23072.1 histidine phosphatase family protein [Flexivirga caeni]